MLFKTRFRLHHRSLKFKIFLSNLCIVFMAFLLFGGILLYTFQKNTVAETLSLSAVACENMTDYIQEKVNSLRHTMDTVALDPQVTSILSSPSVQLETEEWYRNYTELAKISATNTMLSDIREVLIVTDHPMAHTHTSGLLMDYDSLSRTDWYAHSASYEEPYFFLPASSLGDANPQHPDILVFTRPFSFHYYGQKMFFLGYIDREILESILGSGSHDPYSACLLANQDGDILAEHAPFDLGTLPGALLSAQSEGDRVPELRKINGKDYYAGIIPINGCDLKLIYLLDYNLLTRDLFRDNLRKMALILMALLPFVALSSYWVTISLTRRLDQLKRHMLQVSQGDFSMEALSAHEDDEIGVLNQHFNYMATKIALLLDEKVSAGKRMKEIEFLALQAQINPHFLYNTLDLIKWKAIRHRDSEIENLVNSLSDYYRLALGKGREYVPLQAELSHIESYIYIQNKRFDDSILLDSHVPESLVSYLLPRLTLQPVIENAILHGILEKESQEGTITLTAEVTDHFILHILDDGVGMAPELCEQLLQPATPDQVLQSGYGLHNIHDRLQLIYGRESGLQIQSEPGNGTEVTLHLPWPCPISPDTGM